MLVVTHGCQRDSLHKRSFHCQGVLALAGFFRWKLHVFPWKFVTCSRQGFAVSQCNKKGVQNQSFVSLCKQRDVDETLPHLFFLWRGVVSAPRRLEISVTRRTRCFHLFWCITKRSQRKTKQLIGEQLGEQIAGLEAVLRTYDLIYLATLLFRYCLVTVFASTWKRSKSWLWGRVKTKWESKWACLVRLCVLESLVHTAAVFILTKIMTRVLKWRLLHCIVRLHCRCPLIFGDFIFAKNPTGHPSIEIHST